MSDRRPLLERVVDLVVHTPVGVVLDVRERRKAFVQQVVVARWIGEMTVTEGRRRLRSLLGTHDDGTT